MTQQSPPGGTPNRPPDSIRRCTCGLPLLDNETLPCIHGGAASRSERGEDSGNGPKAQVAAAGPAAQSPRVGAAEESRFPEGSAGQLAETIVAWADFSLAHLNEHEPTYWIKNLRLVGSKWLREHAEPDRSTSRRPESSPVASADPEVATIREALQRLLDRHKDWLADGAHGVFGEARRLAAGIDSALSRLAGQEGSNGK